MVLIPSPVYAQYRAHRNTEHSRQYPNQSRGHAKLWRANCLEYDEKANDLNLATAAVEAEEAIEISSDEAEDVTRRASTVGISSDGTRHDDNIPYFRLLSAQDLHNLSPGQ
ncbi:hypothetical protein M8J77_009313 [Diaphorina citri]|nr:hypothetical protein M8J77_009313 [Diaphorina citri]